MFCLSIIAQSSRKDEGQRVKIDKRNLARIICITNT